MRPTLPILLVLALLLSTLPLLAQPPGGRGGPPAGSHGGRSSMAGGPHLERLSQELDLTEDQQADWQKALSAHRESLRPIFDQLQQLHGQIDTLLQSDDPDPAEVGLLVIEQHDLRSAMGEAQELLEAELAGLLTPDQLSRWEEMKQEGRRGFGRRETRDRPV